MLGASTYFVYIGALLLRQFVPSVSIAVYYVASGVIGFGAAVLWTAQGSLLTVMSSPDTLGMFNGIFWAIFMCSYLVGGLITQFVPHGSAAQPGANQTALALITTESASNGDTLATLFIIFTALAGVSVLALLALRGTTRNTSRALNIFETVLLFRDGRMLLLCPIIAYSGLSAAYIFAIYPGHIGPTWIGYCLIVYGVSEAVGSFVGGRVSDAIGRTPVFLFSAVCSAGGVVLGSLSPAGQVASPSWLYFAAFAFLGLGDSGFNTQAQAVVGHYHAKQTQGAGCLFSIFQYYFCINLCSKAAFAFYRGWLSIWAAIGSIAGRFMTSENLGDTWNIMLPSVLLWALLSVSVVCWLVLDKRVEPVWVRQSAGNDIQ